LKSTHDFTKYTNWIAPSGTSRKER